MEPVEVTARFDLQGKIIPVSFTWKIFSRFDRKALEGQEWVTYPGDGPN